MKLRFIFLLFTALISCEKRESNWIDRSKHEGLFKQELTDEFEVYASLEEPKNINNSILLLDTSKKYFDNVFSENLKFAVLFIDSENWDKYAFSPPPGMPQAYYQGNMVLGLGKSVIALNAENGIKNAPEPVHKLLKKHFGEDIDLDLFYRDALSLHELGHLYQFYRTGKYSQRKWLNELFGNLCQVGAARSLDSEMVFNRMDVLQSVMSKGKQWDNLKFKTLSQFENDYFTIMQAGQNYGWYQTQFFFRAKKLHELFGDTILNQFRNFLMETSPEVAGELDDETLQKLIRERFGNDFFEIVQWDYH
ncbi:hypothetical protein M3P19_13030 [Muricauda sp. 2012CJ35-5]|uniref:Uncharacterized protein n=1 Tax=Flagellimonas spongiicola TaxID=2942208 RepID=A0ABT0PU70_9FLAO|nr:hypothetical protein [Allomuricauda spongiicola]MCL6274938.1 hypothetical protein [Allomuricauda spongiicola]